VACDCCGEKLQTNLVRVVPLVNEPDVSVPSAKREFLAEVRIDPPKFYQGRKI
jgi:hypothetical protein